MCERINRRKALRGVTIGAAALMGFAMTEGRAGTGQQTRQPADHCEWLAKIIRDVELIKVGMTRREVEKVLSEEEGGLVQRRKSLRYQHPACSYVKLNVSFQPARGSEKDDKVVERGIPFLDLVPNSLRF